jgi:excisionase family DNA binding protein
MSNHAPQGDRDHYAGALPIVVITAAELTALVADAVARGLRGGAPGTAHAPHEWLTTKEAAELLKVSTATLGGLRSRGEGPAHIKIGSAVRYNRDDLERTGRVASTATKATEWQQKEREWEQSVAQRIGRVSPPAAVARPAQPTPAAPTKNDRNNARAAAAYVTTKEAVAILGVPAHTLGRLRFEGIPHVRIGQAVRYNRADLLTAETGSEPWHQALREARKRMTPRIPPEVAATYLTPEEAAAQLGISAWLLDMLRRDGEGPPFVRIRYLVRYRRVDLDESANPDALPTEPFEGARYHAAKADWRQVIAMAREHDAPSKPAHVQYREWSRLGERLAKRPAAKP